jgi:NADPH:quinone reductase-like Zn-dependent oxidoreductase
VKAFVYERYGRPEVLELRDVPEPDLADDGVLVRVRARSVNPVDWHTMTGTPYLIRTQTGLRGPKNDRLGVDFAGTVEAVGKDVTHVQAGDDVFGARNGAFAEYVSVKEAVVAKPANLSFEEAAAVPVAGITALQGLRDKGQLRAGQHVLVNGASGGVGTYAVQIAKALGAKVTAVCSTRNVEQTHAIGADRVIDYTQEDFTRSGERYDLMLDVAGNRSWSDCKRVLKDDAKLVIAGGPKKNPLLGPIGKVIRMRLVSIPGNRDVMTFLAKTNRADMATLQELLASGKVKSVIDRTYGFDELPDAMSYLGEGHARGKIVVTAQ